jgi:predicted ATP-grasp superfamily ATP-dependent carboligase
LKAERFFGKCILYAERSAVVFDASSWIDRGIRDIPLPNERLRKGNPICTVFSRQTTYKETLTELIRQTARLKDEIYA